MAKDMHLCWGYGHNRFLSSDGNILVGRNHPEEGPKLCVSSHVVRTAQVFGPFRARFLRRAGYRSISVNFTYHGGATASIAHSS